MEGPLHRQDRKIIVGVAVILVAGWFRWVSVTVYRHDAKIAVLWDRVVGPELSQSKISKKPPLLLAWPKLPFPKADGPNEKETSHEKETSP